MPGTAFNPWKVGDRIRFAGQPDGKIYTVTTAIVPFYGPMVELDGMSGEFAAHLFVAADYPADSIVPRPPNHHI